MEKHDSFLPDNFSKTEVFVNPIWSNIVAIIAAALMLGIPFYILKGIVFEHPSFFQQRYDFVIWVISVVAGLFLYEFLHGVFYAHYAKSGFKALKFGVIAKGLMLYCSCNEEIKITHMIQAHIIPVIIMGILPVVCAVLTANITVFLFGVIYIAGGGTADIWLALKLAKYRKDSWAKTSYPSKIGFDVYTPLSA